MLLLDSTEVRRVLEREVIERHVAPGASAAALARVGNQTAVLTGAAGCHSSSDTTRVTADTWFDLASLTKPVTAVCFARYVDKGLLDPAEALQSKLPIAVGSPIASTPLWQLLSHRAGLVPHVELFAPLRDGFAFDEQAALRQVIGGVNPQRRALPSGGFEAVYSDLGYILIGKLLELVGEAPLTEVVGAELAALELEGLRPAEALQDCQGAVAPTESVDFRGGEIRGAVHDDNAYVLSGLGLSGHAGLFGTLGGVASFAAFVLDVMRGRSHRLSPRSKELLLRTRPGGSHRAGFDGKAARGSSVGATLGAQTVGHLGFTGTSFWCDPEQDVAVVLLTNRVCPTRSNTEIRRARPTVHDALADIALTCDGALAPT